MVGARTIQKVILNYSCTLNKLPSLFISHLQSPKSKEYKGGGYPGGSSP